MYSEQETLNTILRYSFSSFEALKMVNYQIPIVEGLIKNELKMIAARCAMMPGGNQVKYDSIYIKNLSAGDSLV